MRLVFWLLAATTARAATTSSSRTIAGPVATLRDGSVLQGITQDHVDRFLGVRYASAPVKGKLRFAPPKLPPSPAEPPPRPSHDLFSGTQNQHVNFSESDFQPRRRSSTRHTVNHFGSGATRFATRAAAQTVDATAYGPQCPQSGDTILGMDEDCLFLNINRPAGIPTTTLLPTLIYMHGGGQQSGTGGASFANFLAAANQTGRPVMVVSLNYRLSIYGFMASTEMSTLRAKEPDADVNWNLGYHDFRQAVQWVKQEGAAFGIDTSKIVIWGQSAGAFGVSALLTAYPSGGNAQPPFSGAIMQSGAPGGTPVAPVSYKDAQYARVLALSGCATSAATGKSLERTHLDCLRQKDWQTLRAVHLAEATRANTPNTYPLGDHAWTAALDDGPSAMYNNVSGFFGSPPSTLIAQGHFANVPVISGNNEDEGTLFTPPGFFSDTELSDWLMRCFFLAPHSSSSQQLFAQILNLYPDDPTVGSPFTVSGSDDTDRFYGVNNQYKRGAAIYGDLRFQSMRRLLMRSVAAHNRTGYNFHYANVSPVTPASLGVPHTTDLNAVLAVNNAVGAIMARQFAFFAHTGNPNGGNLPDWPKYDANESSIQYRNGTVAQIRDDYRAEPINSLLTQQMLDATSR